MNRKEIHVCSSYSNKFPEVKTKTEKRTRKIFSATLSQYYPTETINQTTLIIFCKQRLILEKDLKTFYKGQKDEKIHHKSHGKARPAAAYIHRLQGRARTSGIQLYHRRERGTGAWAAL